MDGEQEKK